MLTCLAYGVRNPNFCISSRKGAKVEIMIDASPHTIVRYCLAIPYVLIFCEHSVFFQK